MRKRQRLIGGILVLYYSAYTALAAFVEPFTWFGAGEDALRGAGWLGHAALLSLPAMGAGVYYLLLKRRDLLVKRFLGVCEVSSGQYRREAFQEIAERSQKHLIIVGIGMIQLVAYDLRSLEEHATSTPIDFLMLDPELVESDATLASHLQHFFDIPDFANKVRASFDKLRSFCEAWNSNPNHISRMRLRVYRTIPTISMVIIDPDEDSGEILMEFFLYQSGADRPRFRIRKVSDKEALFDRVLREFRRLWSGARQII